MTGVNQIDHHKFHGHDVAHEHTPDGVLVTLNRIQPSGKNDVVYMPIKSWKTWEKGQEHGHAMAIELAKHLNNKGTVETFVSQADKEAIEAAKKAEADRLKPPQPDPKEEETKEEPAGETKSDGTEEQ